MQAATKYLVWDEIFSAEKENFPLNLIWQYIFVYYYDVIDNLS